MISRCGDLCCSTPERPPASEGEDERQTLSAAERKSQTRPSNSSMGMPQLIQRLMKELTQTTFQWMYVNRSQEIKPSVIFLS